MRDSWYLDDLRALLGRGHPLVLKLQGRDPTGAPGRQCTFSEPARPVSSVWETEELARVLLVLWRNYPDLRRTLADAAIVIGCEMELLQVARRLQVPALARL